MLYLSIPQHRRDRATHEKARSLRAGELRWVRVYTDDLDDLAGEPFTVRFLDEALLLLASKRGWIIPYNTRRIASRLTARTTDVTKAIDRLLALGRLEIIEVSDDLSTGGNLQMGLDLHPKEVTTHNRVTAESLQSERRVTAESLQPDNKVSGTVTDTVTADVSAQIQVSLDASDPSRDPSRDPRQGHQSRAEQSRRERTTSNATVASNAAPEPRLEPSPSSTAPTAALPVTTNGEDRPLLHRLITQAAHGKPSSAAIIRNECADLPDFVLARTLESLMGRHPRPANPAGYVINSLRSIAAEAGIQRDPPTIAREPRL